MLISMFGIPAPVFFLLFGMVAFMYVVPDDTGSGAPVKRKRRKKLKKIPKITSGNLFFQSKFI